MVKTLVVFEDSYTFYNQFGQRLARTSLLSPEEARGRRERLFLTKSLGLRHLAVAFLVTAERVLHEWEPTWRWPILESLALTSPLLHSGSDGDKIDALLCKAAHIVPQVQHLQTLVLWNGGKANACAFIFHRSSSNSNRDKKCSITWRGNWRFSWMPRILECWNRAAKSLGVVTLFRHELIEAGVHSHEDAIHHLSCLVRLLPRNHSGKFDEKHTPWSRTYEMILEFSSGKDRLHRHDANAPAPGVSSFKMD